MENIKTTLTEISKLESEQNYTAALDLAKQAMRKFPNVPALMIALARLWETTKNFPQALELYKRAHEDILKQGKSSDFKVLVGMANCLYRTNQYAKATDLYEQIYKQIPNHPDVLTGLASCRRYKKQLEEAEKFALEARKLDKEHKPARHELAEILIAEKKTDEAIELLEENISREDLYGDSIDLWMATLDKLNRNRYAQDKLEALHKQFPEKVEFSFGLAVLANRAGEFPLARTAYESAMEKSPNNHRILYELGVMERITGNMERSQELIGKALEIKPDNPAALRTFGNDTKYTFGDDNFNRLSYVAANFTEFSELEQIHLHYALAKAFQDVEDNDTAFRHYGIGGNKKRKMEPYKEKEAAHLTNIIPKVVTAEHVKNSNQTGCQSDVPVFILGMPRSGTSLMEQVLSSHPDIYGAGELKFLTGILENIGLDQMRLRLGNKEPVFDYDLNASWEDRGQAYVDKLQKLAEDPYKRIVDKMPGNFNFVGLIHSIMPNAKIIHSRRHPIETCLSCYRIHFAEGHQWTYDQRELGRYYRRYWDLMKYWRKEFPDAMLEIRYEDNVNDLEGQARKLIDYLDLEWDDNCLDFHNTDRPVKTASASQVRKPIYKSSTNRWRQYEKYLQPLLEEIGDIVEEYEAEIAHWNK